MKIKASAETTHLWTDYLEAREAKSRWAAQEKYLKGELLTRLGYDDGTPASADVIDNATGLPIGTVRVSNRRGVDMKYFREKYPDVYAECERTTHSISIKELEL